MINENDYPDNYDWLSKDMQKAVLDAVEYMDEIGHLSQDALLLLDLLGIKVARGWQGHRDGFFMATYDDAASEVEYLSSLAADGDDETD